MNFFKKMPYFYKITIILSLLFMNNLGWGDRQSPINSKITAKTEELRRMNQQIAGLQNSLVEAKTERKHYEKQLQTIEQNIGLIEIKLSNIDIELKKQDSILLELKERKQKLLEVLNQQQLLLAKQVRAAYMLGQHQYLKLFLNQQDPNTLDRLLSYHGKIHSARLKAITDVKQTLNQLKNVEEKINIQISRLQQLQNKNTIEKNYQTKNLNQRELVLVDLKRVIEKKSLQLETLVDNKRALEELLQKLRPPLETVPQLKIPFNRMRGQLLRPSRGLVIQHFGERIADSSLINNAILISANSGDAVNAVYPGKVVFADWLRGLGLLIIIDHGHGYLTLYGHNHSLLKKTGDSVLAGEMIAKVGNSGGYEKSGLYFQIRADGKPVNPELWLKK